jgi:hypothetical protein
MAGLDVLFGIEHNIRAASSRDLQSEISSRIGDPGLHLTGHIYQNERIRRRDACGRKRAARRCRAGGVSHRVLIPAGCQQREIQSAAGRHRIRKNLQVGIVHRRSGGICREIELH